MTHQTIQLACKLFGPQAIIDAAQKRITQKDHEALIKVGLQDTSTLIEAFAVMDVAIHALNTKGS